MGVEKLNLVATIDGTNIEFSGSKYFYGNSAVSKIIGVRKKTDKDARGNKLEMRIGQEYKKYMVRLVAISAGNIAGIGNQAQRDKKFNISFYCHPDRADNAMLELPGKSVDRGAGLGRLTIQRVHRLRKIQYI